MSYQEVLSELDGMVDWFLLAAVAAHESIVFHLSAAEDWLRGVSGNPQPRPNYLSIQCVFVCAYE